MVHVDGSPAARGRCIEWDSSIAVSSNAPYGIDARGTDTVPGFAVMGDAPDGFAQCAGAAPVSVASRPLVGPQRSGGERTHPFCLTVTIPRDGRAPTVADEVVLEVTPAG